MYVDVFKGIFSQFHILLHCYEAINCQDVAYVADQLVHEGLEKLEDVRGGCF